MITFVYYDQEGDRHEVVCLQMPQINRHHFDLVTDKGAIALSNKEVVSYKTIYDI